MPAVRIKKIHIKGLRGIRKEVILPLEQKSIVLYGDNGAGKSSITDVLEWFYKGKISHLSGEEIGKSGVEGLRNISLPDAQEAFFYIEYSDSGLNCTKKLEVKKGALKQSVSNDDQKFNDFIDASQRENLLIRYKELADFVLSTKTEKLSGLSAIIGFSDVTDIRGVLKKALNEISRELKNRNFDGSINVQQSNLVKQLGQNITSEKHFVRALNELIAPLGIDKKIDKLADIEEVITSIKKPTDNLIIEQNNFLNGIKDFTSNLKTQTISIQDTYQEYEKQFSSIRCNVENLKNIVLGNLLDAGEIVLKNGQYKSQSCPLCLQPKDTTELLKEVRKRIESVQKIKLEQEKLSQNKEDFDELISIPIESLNVLLRNKILLQEEYKGIKTKLEAVKASLLDYVSETEQEITLDRDLKSLNDLKIHVTELAVIEAECEVVRKPLEVKMKDNKFTEALVKIEMSKVAYGQIEALKREMVIIDKQKSSFESIYAEFVKKQKEGLEVFINNFSGLIDEYYQFMNPGEPIKDVKLITVEDGEELVGVSIRFKFFDNEVSPPHKYFSESHLNCFGIAFFLASVKAFNKENKFILLDDVISSFDTNHRKRFADLLIEKFSDYQIILLTHEKQWFEYVRTIVKNKNWLINTLKWSEENGASINEDVLNLRDRIESNIASGTSEKLGNDIREYLEHILKIFAYHLEVKFKFLFNDTNEDRMSFELLSALKGQLLKCGTEFAGSQSLLDRTLNSVFIGNKDSHDASFNPTMGDLKAFWKDVIDIENLLYCGECKHNVSLKFYDEGAKRIRCKCGKKNYHWLK